MTIIAQRERGTRPQSCCFSAGRTGALGPGGIAWHLAWWDPLCE